MAAAAATGVVLTGLSVAVAISGADPGLADWDALTRALLVAVPVGAGCYLWYRRPGERFGPLLVVTGYAAFLTTLAESNGELLYSVGRVSGWLVEVLLVYLILAFPSGRLPGRVDKMLVGAAAALVATLYLPTALFVESYPVPSWHTSCEAGCPANAFLVLGSEPGVIDSLVRPLRELLTILLFLAVTIRLGQRVRDATPLMRLTLCPVLIVAMARLLLLAIALATRRVAPTSPALDTLVWAIALALPAMAASFLVGLLRWRFFLAASLPRLGARLRQAVGPEELRAALAEALGDPRLRLAYWVPLGGGSWVDADGRPMALPPPPESRQCMTEVRDGDRRVAAIVHDVALDDQDELVGGVASYARIALENQRLAAKVESSLADLRASRARIVAAADEERRRIERDLHDGAQQRLVALRIQLQLAEELVREDAERGAQRLHDLGGEVEGTLDEIRVLARGVFPPLLADRGLGEALRAATLRSPIAASVRPDGIARYPQAVESAVYFCCLEALQNASKHARGARTVTILLADNGSLRFEVRDDGAGFDMGSTPVGTGLVNMRDRLAALGGDFAISSEPGNGTVVSGSLPVGLAS